MVVRPTNHPIFTKFVFVCFFQRMSLWPELKVVKAATISIYPTVSENFSEAGGGLAVPPVESPIRWFGFRTVQGNGNGFQRTTLNFGTARGKSAIPLLVKRTPEHLRKSAADTQAKGLYNRQGIATGFITNEEHAVS
jgi:hypothetical protein